jgi:hypothetical protein
MLAGPAVPAGVPVHVRAHAILVTGRWRWMLPPARIAADRSCGAQAAAVGPAVAAPAGAVRPAASQQLRSLLRSAVEAIAGPPVQIRCSIRPQDAGLFDVLGHADWEHRLIELAPQICRDANALVAAPAPAYSAGSFAQARALLVVVHESVHLSGYPGRTDEAFTECRAIQLIHETALRIGVDDATARALGHEALRFDAQLPRWGDWRVGLREIPNYHSPDCYPGGSLDIHPNSTDWPN